MNYSSEPLADDLTHRVVRAAKTADRGDNIRRGARRFDCAQVARSHDRDMRVESIVDRCVPTIIHCIRCGRDTLPGRVFARIYSRTKGNARYSPRHVTVAARDRTPTPHSLGHDPPAGRRHLLAVIPASRRALNTNSARHARWSSLGYATPPWSRLWPAKITERLRRDFEREWRAAGDYACATLVRRGSAGQLRNRAALHFSFFDILTR